MIIPIYLYECVAVAIVLLIMSYFDMKDKSVLSIIPTSLILFLLILNSYANPQLLYFGILGAVYGLFLYEFDFIRGIADVKAVVIVSLIIRTMPYFFVFMILFIMVGIVWKILMLKIIAKRKNESEINLAKDNDSASFIPAITLTYIILLMIIHFV